MTAAAGRRASRRFHSPSIGTHRTSSSCARTATSGTCTGIEFHPGHHRQQHPDARHATDFILDSDKKVVDACYSIGPIGRIVAADALGHVQFFKKKAQAK
jgi:hypothetical protein